MKTILLPALIALVALLPRTADAADAFHISITGSIQGAISGGGPNDVILGLAAEHEVVVPLSATTGQPTGVRQHKPFTITKAIDKSSPLLNLALVSGEQLTTVKFTFFRTSVAGGKEVCYTIELTNALIVNIRLWKPSVKDPMAVAANFGEYEEVSLTYEKIIWTWTPDGIEAQDSRS